MKSWLKKTLLGLGGTVGVLGLVVGGYVFSQVRAFDESMAKVYDLPLPSITISADPEVIARGEHLARAIAPCTNSDCHGKDLAGGKTMAVGPIMTVTAPNITKNGLGAAYSDAELFRLIRHGVKKDGRSARMMPSNEFNWLPDSDVIAIISWLRTMPGVDRANQPIVVKPLGKVLDRRNAIPIDVARRINHSNIEIGPAPSDSAAYGRFLGHLCGCHGEGFSGGHIEGTPPDFPVPLNLTPHETGLKGYTYEQFVSIINTGVRRDGRKLDPFMPVESYSQMNETEKRALFAFLSALPPRPFGNH